MYSEYDLLLNVSLLFTLSYIVYNINKVNLCKHTTAVCYVCVYIYIYINISMHHAILVL